ncbi:ubiquitin carboxyl-terminal hydrolase [Pyrenophora seminiperda CCB06]|uniref:ubiquitinyl hydrolase 1 n=1 Tax=Pyrenophora seminiperda CCB06 TaxID=1302712 RepID=A0A3M7M763_9PLEO|nr:ubiquitin carboxyl-terminal hydrolase [Pyrenophora seminiperda CCB06]
MPSTIMPDQIPPGSGADASAGAGAVANEYTMHEQAKEQASTSDMSANATSDAVSLGAEQTEATSAAESANGSTSPIATSKTASPNARKRGLPEAYIASEPSSKKYKDSPSPSSNRPSTAHRFPSPPDMPATIFDKETWQGFCDIESEPACFSVILREMGVQDVTVREAFLMDQDFILENIPQPIYGFILLFHYREFGNDSQADECPKDVWFANQLPAQNSCATLAMINILMNQSNEAVIGDHLEQFKDFTNDFTPYQRGEAFASFDFVKKIHNSFAKKMDILEGDKHLSYKVKRAERLKIQTVAEKTKPSKRGTKTRRLSDDSVATQDSLEFVENNAHHYIAFVPVGNQVWKLDGLDMQPTCVGSFDTENGETWLGSACDTISALMAAGDDDYGVIAITQSPLRSLRNRAGLTINTITHVDERLDHLSAIGTCPDWRQLVDENEQPPSPRMLGVEGHVAANPIQDGVKAAIAKDDIQQLINRRRQLLSQANDLSASIMMEMQNEAEEDAKATQRRYDSGPVIKKWLEMLAENGFLEENLERFMPGKGKK